MQGRRKAIEVSFQPFPCPGSLPGSGEISVRGQRPDRSGERTEGRAPEAPNRRGSLSSEFGSYGKQVQTAGPEVFSCPPSAGGARRRLASPERPGWLRVVQALQHPTQQVGPEAAIPPSRLPAPSSSLFLLLPRSVVSLLVLLLEGHGSSGPQIGAATEPRVQWHLRGVEAGLQRARLPAAVRAAPAGAQDAAGAPGGELQVAGLPWRWGRPGFY